LVKRTKKFAVRGGYRVTVEVEGLCPEFVQMAVNATIARLNLLADQMNPAETPTGERRPCGCGS
jgi:hypothetical protein